MCWNVEAEQDKWLPVICVFRGHCPMIYSNQFITRKITYFNNYLATAAMVPFCLTFPALFVIHPLTDD